MKTSVVVWVVVAVAIVAIGGILLTRRDNVNPTPSPQTTSKTQQTSLQVTSQTMRLTSTAFQHNTSIPSQYTCDGNDISPPLAISDVPSESKSLALIMDDPDAPAGVWDHWVVFNISPSTTSIPEGQEPLGVHGKGTSGNTNYKGPCPPDRQHRYFFKLFALDTMLDLAEGSTKAQVEQAMKGHVLDQTELIGLYNRK